MPTLDWIGKRAVVNHAREVAYRLLKCEDELSWGDASSGNLLVEGDNLRALKALLPFYAGSVKCIYIDPPYNTGNEGWIYNDAANAPEIKKWLQGTLETRKVNADDLSRHDKWLCMMYPRLVLLREMLRPDGAIFISIDDNEVHYLRALMDEIFGAQNFVSEIIWKKSYGGGSKANHVVGLHEYILCFARNKENIANIELPPDVNSRKYYTGRDEKYESRGPFRTQPLATNSMDARPNLRFPICYQGQEIWPEKQWQWSRDRVELALSKNELLISQQRGKWSVRYKQYLYDEQGKERGAKPYSILDGPYTQEGTEEIKAFLGDGKAFTFPKPSRLIKHLLSFFCQDKDSIVLDSFAGSGTTGQAVMQLNAEDGGHRRFVLVEMEPHIARNVTRERLVRAGTKLTEEKETKDDRQPELSLQSASSSPTVPGQAPGFRFCVLGEPLFEGDGSIRPDVEFRDLAHHVFFTETGRPLPAAHDGTTPFLGEADGVGLYLLWQPGAPRVLDEAALKACNGHRGAKIIYADGCRVSPSRLRRANVQFKQVPYEIRT